RQIERERGKYRLAVFGRLRIETAGAAFDVSGKHVLSSGAAGITVVSPTTLRTCRQAGWPAQGDKTCILRDKANLFRFAYDWRAFFLWRLAWPCWPSRQEWYRRKTSSRRARSNSSCRSRPGGRRTSRQ